VKTIRARVGSDVERSARVDADCAGQRDVPGRASGRPAVPSLTG
jgi:hypothetical protein